jgi:hypothetical protein
MKPHRPARNMRLPWLIFICILAATIVAGLFVDRHAYFTLDGSFAFKAWFGFTACIAMIIIAKLLGRLLHRKDDYYDRD